jgi:hypothetical protein
VNGKALCLICSENVALLKECNIILLGIAIHSTKIVQKLFQCSEKKKIGGFEKRISSENCRVIVPLHCGQVIVLLICWLREANLFLMGNS